MMSSDQYTVTGYRMQAGGSAQPCTALIETAAIAAIPRARGRMLARRSRKRSPAVRYATRPLTGIDAPVIACA
ncbi:hypothetical protein WT27_29145 [Burkholderia territorii]|uniref:Uncharacterized protein n=1 Tax=Burkholderia territorii TaxID=1503055 RepID=A0A105VQ25_9BURK|nr:hypothetical protein WT27_29145 [Burkholderia territorii]KVX43051.1 hypothetical protein WT31_26850 [Burkholderia territorii]